MQASYQAGRGGGLIGGWVYSALVINLTELGAFVAVLMALTIAAMLVTRSSIVELAVIAISISRNLSTRVSQVAVERRAARLKAGPATGNGAGSQPCTRPQTGASPARSGQGCPDRPLPAPSSAWMPIPNRLKALFGRRVNAEAAMEAESLALEPAVSARAPSIKERLLKRRGGTEPAIAEGTNAETWTSWTPGTLSQSWR